MYLVVLEGGGEPGGESRTNVVYCAQGCIHVIIYGVVSVLLQDKQMVKITSSVRFHVVCHFLLMWDFATVSHWKRNQLFFLFHFEL